jgi:hypothetical protein
MKIFFAFSVFLQVALSRGCGGSDEACGGLDGWMWSLNWSMLWLS